MERISKKEYYLKIAETVSLRSTCLKRNYGCIIVKNDEVISTGYNGSARGEVNCCDKMECPRINKPHNTGDYSDCPAVHAEQNAMLSAARKDMIGATMYLCGMEGNQHIETEPCPICWRMIKNSGIKKVITHDKEVYLWEVY
ncbi:MAG: cytidine deaminase [Methanobrevibacter sp.]|nr:cytidine deaminase [Methanobrevibacter sp.]